jgi:hypothetical protein
MISVHQLAEIISHSPKGTALRQISRQPGKERYRGLCPFPHHERTPSFDVFVGADGAGHYFCHSCHESGSAEWWQRKVEGKNIGTIKPDPGIVRQRKQEQRRAQQLRSLERRFYDQYPDAVPEWQWFLQSYVPSAQEDLK